MQDLEFSILLAINLTVSCNPVSLLLGSGGVDTKLGFSYLSQAGQLHKEEKHKEKFTVKTAVDHKSSP